MSTDLTKFDSSGNAVALPGLADLPAGKIESKEFDEIVTSFYPIVALGQDMAKPVKEGHVKAGDFYIKKGATIIPLGNRINITTIANKWTAIDSNDPKRFVYDKDSEDFKDIQKKSNESNSGCFWGPEYLVWIPEHGFAAFLFGSKTMHRVAAEVQRLFKNTITLQSETIQGKRNSWYGANVNVAAPDPTIPSDREALLEAIEKFHMVPGEELDSAVAEENSRA